jgi:hypothetical protein
LEGATECAVLEKLGGPSAQRKRKKKEKPKARREASLEVKI